MKSLSPYFCCIFLVNILVIRSIVLFLCIHPYFCSFLSNASSPQMTLKHQEINEEKDLLQQLRNNECLEDLLTISGLASIRQKGAKIRMYAEEEHY